MSDYPRGRKYWAHRVCRMLAKSCAAQDIGAAAAYLVVTIAMVEDAKRYSGAVTFFTGQLLPILGLRKWDQLERIRTAAVAAGWLHYENRGRRAPGRYWTLIPAAFEQLDDSPIDESSGFSGGITPASGGKSGDNSGCEAGLAPVSGGFAEGQTRVSSGEPPILFLNPYPENTPLPPKGGNAPDAEPQTKTRESTEKKLTRIRQELVFPPELSCEPCRNAMDDWLGYKRDRRKFYGSADGPNRLLVRWARHGPDAFCDAVDEAISKNWEGLVEPDKRYTGGSGGRQQPRARVGQFDPEVHGGRDPLAKIW